MKTHLVGTYELGVRPIRLFVAPEHGNGSVKLTPDDGGSTKVIVGLYCPWKESISILLHELYEATLIDLNTRYECQPSYARGASDFVFFMTHNQLGEAHDRVGDTLIEILPKFEKAYKKYSPYKK